MFGSDAMRHVGIGLLLFKYVSKSLPKTQPNLRLFTAASGTSSVAVFSTNLRNMNNYYNTSRSTWSQKPPLATKGDNIVWFDMEMTGLDPDKDHVLEVACLVTDSQLKIVAEGPDLCIYQPDEVLDQMNEWSIKQHGESGLTKKCQDSAVTLREAEKQLLDFVRTHAPFKRCPLGGNTIYMDRLFLMKHMPDFEQHMHYRIIDVSSIKELCSRWYPEIFAEQPNKKEESKHRAMEDVKATINELKFYKDKIFRKAEVGEAMGMSWC